MRRFKIILCVAFGLAFGSSVFAENNYQPASNVLTGSESSDSNYLTLKPDVGRVAALRGTHQIKNFFYHGEKGQRVTIKVESVHFLPQVTLRKSGGEAVASQMNREGEGTVEVDHTFLSSGDYTVQVRANGAGQGTFVIELSQQAAETDQGKNVVGSQGK